MALMQRLDTQVEELANRIETALPEDGSIEPLPGLHLTRSTVQRELVYGVLKPTFCITAAGAKEVYAGECRYLYDQQHYLIATAELPVRGVRLMPDDRPYLAMMVDLDPALVGSVMIEAGISSSNTRIDSKALGVSPLDPDILDAAIRLVKVIDSPSHARMLVPLIKREIVYRLLTGEQAQRLSHFPSPSGQRHVIAQALQRLRREFDQPLRIESLARELGMSSTRFHHHFKAVTDMTPLQFQKQLRLQEARRLMVCEDLDASSASYRVGYDDPSYFSRDYKKHFGQAPMRDVAQLKTASTGSSGA
ncbi:MAG TPA: AraC family transcriptional regulator [Fimbriimonadaceae bacterium]|nr:AraC family transcriptional regulator [Fimbriimonadaceae bacterium]